MPEKPLLSLVLYGLMPRGFMGVVVEDTRIWKNACITFSVIGIIIKS